MGIVIGAKPESSFADPLGLLSDCHRRIEKFLQTLIRVVTQVQESIEIADRERKEENEGGGVHVPVESSSLSADQRSALETALRYFREAAPRHTRDEEDSLFPKMRESDSDDAKRALAAIATLEADHTAADIGHAEIERLGSKWLADGAITRRDLENMREILANLQSLYQHHLEVEDKQVFPLAAQCLDPATVQRIGREMADRRGINLDTLADLKLRCPTKRKTEQTLL